MPYDEKYLYELPDFILGRSSPDTIKEIELLISTDETFRKEYESMKKLLLEVETPLEQAFVKPSPLYFANFSTRLNERLSHSHLTYWERLLSAAQSFFAEPLQPKLIGGLASLAVICLLIFTVSKFDTSNTPSKTDFAFVEESVEFNSVQAYRDETELATITYALGSSFSIADLNDAQSDVFLKKIDEELPSEVTDFKVLSKDDIKSLLN